MTNLDPHYYRADIDPRFDPANPKHFDGFEKIKWCKGVRRQKIDLMDDWLSAFDEKVEALRDKGPKLPRRGRKKTSVQALWREDLERRGHFFHKIPRAERLKCERVRNLRDKLRVCCRQSRCGSRACTVCRRQHRRWFVSEFLRIADGRPILFLTCTPLQGGFAPQLITKPLVQRLKKRFLKHLERHLPDIAQAFGCIDLKVYLDGKLEPHIHCVVLGCSAKMLRSVRMELLANDWTDIGLEMPHLKRGMGAPWVVSEVYPRDRWKVITYTARQTPRRDEVGGSSWRERVKNNKQLKQRIHNLDIERLLFLDSLTVDDATVCFRVERKNGLRLRSNIKLTALQLLRERAVAKLELKAAKVRKRKREERVREKDRVRSMRQKANAIFAELRAAGEF